MRRETLTVDQIESGKLYTTAQAGDVLGIGEQRVATRIRRGKIGATKPPGARAWLISGAELLRLLNPPAAPSLDEQARRALAAAPLGGGE